MGNNPLGISTHDRVLKTYSARDPEHPDWNI